MADIDFLRAPPPRWYPPGFHPERGTADAMYEDLAERVKDLTERLTHVKDCL